MKRREFIVWLDSRGVVADRHPVATPGRLDIG